MKPAIRVLNDGRFMCTHRGHIKAVAWGDSMETAWINCERQYNKNKRRGRIDRVNAAYGTTYFAVPFNEDVTAMEKIKRWFK